MRNANLSNTNLYEADLSGSNLRGASLIGSNLAKVLLQGAIYDELTKWPHGFNPDVLGAKSAGSDKG